MFESRGGREAKNSSRHFGEIIDHIIFYRHVGGGGGRGGQGGPCIIKAMFKNKKIQVITCQWEEFQEEVIHKESEH